MIILEIPELPKLTNAMGKSSIWYTHNERNKWRKLVGYKLMEISGKPAEPFKKARLTLTRFSSREADWDGLAASWKYPVDALVYNGVIIDDKPSVIEVKCLWEKCSPKLGKVKIEIEEIKS